MNSSWFWFSENRETENRKLIGVQVNAQKTRRDAAILVCAALLVGCTKRKQWAGYSSGEDEDTETEPRGCPSDGHDRRQTLRAQQKPLLAQLRRRPRVSLAMHEFKGAQQYLVDVSIAKAVGGSRPRPRASVPPDKLQETARLKVGPHPAGTWGWAALSPRAGAAQPRQWWAGNVPRSYGDG